jgi:purine-binding chemotaxis protein CheW
MSPDAAGTLRWMRTAALLSMSGPARRGSQRRHAAGEQEGRTMTAPAPQSPSGSITQFDSASYMLLRLADECYALESSALNEITRWREPISVPGSPPVLPGIINQRGVVLPVVHLRVLLGLGESAPERATRYLVAQHGEVMMALLVDAVLDLVDLSGLEHESPPATLNPQQARVLQAVVRRGEQLVLLLNLGEIVALLRGEG